jgi:membrane-bound serine protease (ClpP class)
VSRTRWGKKFVLQTSQKGAVSSQGHDNLDLVGREGVAESNLHPAGTALVEGRKIDVISSGVYIRKGSRIRVIEASGPRIVVEEIV